MLSNKHPFLLLLRYLYLTDNLHIVLGNYFNNFACHYIFHNVACKLGA